MTSINEAIKRGTIKASRPKGRPTKPRRQRKHNRIHITDAVAGEEGLIIAIIAQAAKDITRGNDLWRQDAERYFRSKLYHHHMSLIGLPTMLPKGIRERRRSTQPNQPDEDRRQSRSAP